PTPPPLPTPPLFPYTTLFRSRRAEWLHVSSYRLPVRPSYPPAGTWRTLPLDGDDGWKVVDHPEWGGGYNRRPATRIPPPVSRSGDRKSTRLNSSHVAISYAVF